MIHSCLVSSQNHLSELILAQHLHCFNASSFNSDELELTITELVQNLLFFFQFFKAELLTSIIHNLNQFLFALLLSKSPISKSSELMLTIIYQTCQYIDSNPYNYILLTLRFFHINNIIVAVVVIITAVSATSRSFLSIAVSYLLIDKMSIDSITFSVLLKECQS